MKWIIDTDIGTDIDDAIALGYAVKSNLDLALISTVHGDTRLRATIAKRILAMLDAEVPVVAGEEKPLKQTYIYWTGIEGSYIADQADPRIPANGIETIIETVKKNKHNIGIVSIGPLTNIAKALRKEPALSGWVNHLYVMGNAITRDGEFFLNYRAHNFKADPEAIDEVVASGIPMTIITTQLCKQHALTKQDLANLAVDPYGTYLHQAALKWLDFINYESAFLYDPLVVHHAIDPTLTEKKQYGHVAVTMDVKPGFDRIVRDSLSQSLYKSTNTLEG